METVSMKKYEDVIDVSEKLGIRRVTEAEGY
jgi:hypothetical protein